jgi:hypothetical protein
MQTISAKLPDLEAAEAAVQALLDAHLPADAISVMAPVDGELEERSLAHQTGMGPGATVGGTLGAIAGLLGATVAGGPVGAMSVLVAATASGTMGGAVAGLAWWRATATTHADDFDDHAAVWVAVRHPTLAVRAARVLRERGVRVYERGCAPRPAAAHSFPASDPPASNPGHA